MTRTAAYSLIETVMASMLVSIMIVTAVHAMAFVARTTSGTYEAEVAYRLAQELLCEISSRAFSDPDRVTTELGIDPGESASRPSTWDDFDDYNQWTNSSLEASLGGSLGDSAGWSMGVKCTYCDPLDPLQNETIPTSLKKCVVRLISPSGHGFEFMALRSDQGTSLGALPAAKHIQSRADIRVKQNMSEWRSSAKLLNFVEAD